MTGSDSGNVIDNQARDRFELAVNGEMAFLLYKRTPEALVLIHTEVPPAGRGHRVGEALVEAALESARAAGLRIIPVCPFAKAYIRRHSAHSAQSARATPAAATPAAATPAAAATAVNPSRR
jgi:predicted GNAT family acetyltransferase